MTAEAQRVGSFDPEQFTEGGFFDDRDCTIVASEIVEFDYRGKADPVCALHVRLRPDDAEGDDDERSEYYRIGGLDKFTPSADRQHYIPVGSSNAMNKGTKAALFMRALKEKGFQMSKLSEGVGALVGLHVHVNIVPMEIRGEKKEGQKDSSILIVTKIHDTPAAGAKAAGGKKAKAAAGKPNGAAAPAAVAASPAADSDVESKAVEIVLGVMDAKGGKATKAQLAPAAFTGITGDAKLRNAVVGLLSNAAWLGGADRPWQYDGGEISPLG